MTPDELHEQNEGLRRDSRDAHTLLDAAGVPDRAAHARIRVARLIADRDTLQAQVRQLQQERARRAE